MGEIHTRVAAKLDEIEAEMRRLGIWDDAPPAFSAEELRAAAPFGGEVMDFERWLQLVLLPNARAIVEAEGSFPARSQVGAFAMRAIDDPAEAELRRLLRDFDNLF